MRKTLAAITTVGALAVSLLIGSPAQAAGTCTSGGAAQKPVALSAHRFALGNVKHTGFTGTPFSFQLVLQYGGFPGETYSKTYTYDAGYRFSINTGSLRAGKAVRVRTWCGGKRGADWVGSVYNHG